MIDDIIYVNGQIIESDGDTFLNYISVSNIPKYKVIEENGWRYGNKHGEYVSIQTIIK